MRKENKLSAMFYKDTIQNSNVKNTSSQKQDPRIVSPEIQVLYPAQDDQTTQPVQTETRKEAVPIQAVEFPLKETNAEKEPHECKLTLEQAVSQHWVSFAIASVVLIGLGVLIGKSKSSLHAV